ncbi:sigma 54-interacting transcriptional regulator [Bacillus sp. DTU_2020_1000418_1_SI_GHA_SEK_038]|uniref:sigma 54-interacting transcriptional regulator n=1 Tax=Bacillus sp. DTU_2020_1000418_1_SI_GHA_SEK_038 TaxID=3077585 RepID=UPI0028EAF269|nr:sigma 54-interacting transcriptional regulator [Bacillus sp. DTU_2020_1000418_1_SI_GHA_SEK_038]WNS74945.1 sigma 54-interacting transcriptional regulator [Bacillus sp. DTU_2020_1000418_1_SI_GHA_SEK_038]
MIIWKDILKPISIFVDVHSTIESVIHHFSNQDADIVLVTDQGSLVGYCTKELLLNQIAKASDLKQMITYRNDILKVPQFSPVEFYHNVSLIIGINEKEEIVGYTTIEQARHGISELRLKDINLLLHGAGVGIVRTNINYQIEFINETAENILGIPSSFLMLRNYKTLLTNDKDLDKVLNGETLVSVNSSINFKQLSGNFYPLQVDGIITGLVHVFFSREVFEEAVHELDFVRNLNSDLQAVYASSQEQILVIDGSGKIIRVAGMFLGDFWKVEKPENIIGKNIDEFSKRNIFQPNVFELCQKQKKKVTAIQDSAGSSRVWSVATPVYHEGKLEKVVVLSRDITQQSSSLKDDDTDQSLHNRLENNHNEKRLVYRSKKIEQLVTEIKRVAQFNSTILLEGDSGVGKEVFAHKIHTASPRSKQPFVRINCGAIPENLIESELFGYEKGSFTGADKNGKAGLFEMANNGTLFLDEIGELPLNMQVKLLRVLQEREVTRIGGVRPIAVNVRIITATNKDLQEMVNQGEFREDLYYRLYVIPFRIPALSERKEDILPLSIHFLEKFKQMYDIKKSFTPEAIEVLETYAWPGNVRELQNIVERLILLTDGEWIQREHALKYLYGEVKKKKKQLFVLELMPLKEAVEELETQLIERGMQKYRTADKLSKVLGVSPATISRRIKKLK